MLQQFNDSSTGGRLTIYAGETRWEQVYYQQKKGFSAHTIAWNTGKPVKIWIDEVPFIFPADSVLPIMLNQSFRFEDASDIIAWQFDRNFYCLQNHDSEVGCYGFLFFGPLPTMFIQLNEDGKQKMANLYGQFIAELECSEEVKGGMLRALLVNLIIQLTRLAKKQHLQVQPDEQNFDLLRKFNFLVELHYRRQHQVRFYASELHRSPKTIANLFSSLSSKTPLQVIHERIMTEAKRLLIYTDRSVKEIAADLGFSDHTHFSKFFKNHTGKSPTEFNKPD